MCSDPIITKLWNMQVNSYFIIEIKQFNIVIMIYNNTLFFILRMNVMKFFVVFRIARSELDDSPLPAATYLESIFISISSPQHLTLPSSSSSLPLFILKYIPAHIQQQNIADSCLSPPPPLQQRWDSCWCWCWCWFWCWC